MTTLKPGDTVREALDSQRWTLKSIIKLASGTYGALERKDGKGTVVNYVKLERLVKADD